MILNTLNTLTEHASPYIAHGLLAIFGAFVHATKAHRDNKSKTLVDFLSLVFMSSFSGIMFSLVGLSLFGIDSYTTLAMAGTGGFLGVEGMALVIKYVENRTKVK